MECNKDEAIRAKGIAEDRLRINDFEGARKFALKAQKLHPEVENISQMLSICDVHCAAQQSLVGVEKDWYGILQLQRLADVETIRKQYRRLALILHPDKNRFPGAEAAFKLISEANALLSDAVKKSVYDSKVQVLARGASTAHQAKTNVHSNLNQNHHQAKGSSSSIEEDVFWTSCRHCNIRCKCDRQFIKSILRCPSCQRPYTASEMLARNALWGQQASAVSSIPGPSSESVDASINTDLDDVPNKQTPGNPPSGCGTRRSRRSNHNSSYNDDPTTSPKRSKTSKSSDDCVKDQKEVLNGESLKNENESGVPVDPTNSGLERKEADIRPKSAKKGAKSFRPASETSSTPKGSYNDDPTTSPKRSKTSKSSDDCVKDQKEVLNGESLKNENESGVPVDATNSGLERKEADIRPKSAKKGAKSAKKAETSSTPKGSAGVDRAPALRRSPRLLNSLKKNSN